MLMATTMTTTRTVCTHIVRNLLQNCLLPELVVSEADPQWSCTKTTGLDVVLTLLQPNVRNVFIIIFYSQIKIMSTNSVLQHQTCKNREQQACDQCI